MFWPQNRKTNPHTFTQTHKITWSSQKSLSPKLPRGQFINDDGHVGAGQGDHGADHHHHRFHQGVHQLRGVHVHHVVNLRRSLYTSHHKLGPWKLEIKNLAKWVPLLPFSWAWIVSDKKYLRRFEIFLSEKCDFSLFLAERFSNISYLKQFTPKKMGAEVLILPNS